MKTKLDLAHEYAMKHTANKDSRLDTIEKLVHFAWTYADAMYEELEKRESKENEYKRNKLKELLNSQNTFVAREGQHFDDVHEWQPDWSQAPEWAKWWAMDKTRIAYWYAKKPKINFRANDFREYDSITANSELFGYTGDWKDSLRERPND